MPELDLTRSREDRKLYVLDGVGSLRLHGWMSRGATAEANGRSWEIERRGIFTFRQPRRSINRDMMICERVRTTEDSR